MSCIMWNVMASSSDMWLSCAAPILDRIGRVSAILCIQYLEAITGITFRRNSGHAHYSVGILCLLAAVSSRYLYYFNHSTTIDCGNIAMLWLLDLLAAVFVAVGHNIHLQQLLDVLRYSVTLSFRLLACDHLAAFGSCARRSSLVWFMALASLCCTSPSSYNGCDAITCFSLFC